MQKELMFHPRNGITKRPIGAVKAGAVVFFSLGISDHILTKKVWLVIKYDRHDAAAWYEMTAREEAQQDDPFPGYTMYSAEVDFEDTGIYWYHFEVQTDIGYLCAGRSEKDDGAVVQDGPDSGDILPWQQTVYRREGEEPDWIYGGVYYHIFVDRFCKSGREHDLSAPDENASGAVSSRPPKIRRDDWGGMPVYTPDENCEILNNDFFGGDIKGIESKLPYLSELGVTCLYLSPIFEAYSNHKYDTADYTKIDPAFGTERDLEELCAAAKKHGMRVILDGVFAHTGADSVYFNKFGTYGDGGAWQDPDSPYRNWYTFYEDGGYDCWWGISTLPKVNKKEPSYIEFITGEDGIARRWLRRGVSGWRLDVADELPVDFMKSLSAAVHDEKEDALLIGEVWEDASNKVAYEERKNYFEGDKLDSVMDYPLKNAIISFVRDGDSKNIALTTERICENYPPFAVNALMNNLGTHDSVRILTALAGKKIKASMETRQEQSELHLSDEEYEKGKELLKRAVLLQMTLPGVPCVYYGDEAGMEGYADPFNRLCYPWGSEDKDILEWYRKLIKIRRAKKVYERGVYRTLVSDNKLYVFSRGLGSKGEKEIVTAVNMGKEARTLPLEGEWKDLLNGGGLLAKRFNTRKGPILIGPMEMMLIERIF